MRFRALIFLFVLTFLGCATEERNNISLSDFVSPDALAAIQINDLQSLRDSLEVNGFLSRFENLSPYRSIQEKISFLDQLDQDSKGILVFSRSEHDSLEFFFVSENLSKIFSIDSLRIKYAEKIDYRNRSFHKYTVNDRAVYSVLADNMLYLSSSASLLDKALEKNDAKAPHPIFQRLYKIADKKRPVNIFINLVGNDSTITRMTSGGSKILASSLGDWIYYDLDIRSDLFAMSGVAIANDSMPQYLNLFKRVEPLPNALPFFAPVESEAILSYSFQDYKALEANLQHYLGRSTHKDSVFEAVEEIGKIYLNNEKAVLLKTYGSENLMAFLANMQKSAIDYQGNTIRELNKFDFLNSAFEPLVQDFNAKYFAMLDNVFVFGQNKEILQVIISNYKKGSTFDKNPVYASVSKNLGTTSNILFIANANEVEELLIDEFTNEIYSNIKDPKLEGYAFGAQVLAEEDFYHVNLSAQKIGKKRAIKTIRPIFNVALDTTLASDPQFVANHNTKRKEIIAQDVNNVLYLISPSGKILWKKQLAGRVQGKMHQVDIYKNGKLQLAFTTNDRFLILDRNGKEVKPFTFSYEGGNLNPLAVFDYEGKKDYRFVVTQGEKVFMYNRKGEIVTGFKYTRAESPILRAPKHMVIGNKDHLVFLLEGGTLKILNRVGDVRVRVNDPIDFSENNVYLHKNKFTVSDKNGVLHQIDGRGKIERTNFNLNPDHGLEATANTLVYMNDNELNIKGKKIELDLGVYTKPKIFYLYDKIYIGVTDIQNQKVYLFDSQAKPIPNFPIYGTSIIDLDDIDNNKKLELLVQNQNNSITLYSID